MIGPLLRLEGELSPWRYALIAPPLILFQHGLVIGAHAWLNQPIPLGPWFWLAPLTAFPTVEDPVVPGLAMLSSIVVTWLLVVASFRRAGWSRTGFPLAALTAAPLLQFPSALMLALLKRKDASEVLDSTESRDGAGAIALGMLAGAALTVAGVAVSTLVFRSYGIGVFALLPFLVGLTTAYVANRSALQSPGRTASAVFYANLLGAVGLIAFALEGFVCLVMAAPLAAGMAAVGGVIGRAVAKRRHRDAASVLFSNAVLPLVFFVEALVPASVQLETARSIDIAAPPAAVWATITRLEPVEPPPGLAFRLGLAYPIDAGVSGQGVGAEGVGRFSTGEAKVRVTAWEPERRLVVQVLETPPALKELSPYAHVHAPHVHGYFETRETSFELIPMTGESTRLTIRARHELKLDPAPYWAPFARWAARATTDHGLQQVKAAAERAD
jgi:hypothetical protein